MKSAWVLLPVLLLSTHSVAQSLSPGCKMLAEGRSSPAEIDRFYGDKAVDIIRIGLAGDKTTLGNLIASGFSYTIQDADNFFGPRSDTGVPAAIRLAEYLEPKGYRISSPLTLLLQRKYTCIWTVTVVFEKAHNRDAVAADFTFTDDKLSQVVGRTMVEFRDDLH